MRKMLTVFALLDLIGGPAAFAQTGGRTGSSAGASRSSGTSNSGGPIEAPVGHRQPRPSDLPSNVSEDPTHLNADDAALDRKIKSICRGC
jgi:hypothetical protein